jgi:hypothetical protein
MTGLDDWEQFRTAKLTALRTSLGQPAGWDKKSNS